MPTNDPNNPNAFNKNVINAKSNRAQEKRGLPAGKAGILSGGTQADMKKVEGTGPVNRHGMPKLPVGQREVPNWPVLDLGIQPDISLTDWSLDVKGAVENPFTLSWKEFMALEQVKDVSDFHCVTTWSRMDNEWEGVRFKTIANLAGAIHESPRHKPKFVYITGYDGYSTNLKLEECLDDDVLLVHTWQGQPLPREHGGPVRMITPRKYAWKGSKWIKEIIFLEKEELGFWEVRGYSNSAEPWFNDRYS